MTRLTGFTLLSPVRLTAEFALVIAVDRVLIEQTADSCQSVSNNIGRFKYNYRKYPTIAQLGNLQSSNACNHGNDYEIYVGGSAFNLQIYRYSSKTENRIRG